MTAEPGEGFFDYRFRQQLTRNVGFVMWRHNAVYAPPRRRWTFMGYGISRRHEHYFNGGSRRG